MPATITAVTIDGKIVYKVSYTLTDGDLGDDDLKKNGVIVDPVGGAQQAQGGQGGTPATSIPTLSEWAKYLLILFLLAIGSRVDWRKKLKF